MSPEWRCGPVEPPIPAQMKKAEGGSGGDQARERENEGVRQAVWQASKLPGQQTPGGVGMQRRCGRKASIRSFEEYSPLRPGGCSGMGGLVFCEHAERSVRGKKGEGTLPPWGLC